MNHVRSNICSRLTASRRTIHIRIFSRGLWYSKQSQCEFCQLHRDYLWGHLHTSMCEWIHRHSHCRVQRRRHVDLWGQLHGKYVFVSTV